MNPVLEYYDLISAKKLLTSKKILRTYKHVVEDIILNDHSDYYFDEIKADKVIKFIERYCRHSKGKYAGKPLLLTLRQKAQISVVFGIIHKETGFRKYTKAINIEARKNGKSTVASAIGLYMMVGDGEGGSEVYSVATKKDQAKIIWNEAKRMVNKSPSLRKRIKPLVAELKADFNDSVFKPLGRDSETLDGLNVHGALFDEIHAWTDMNMVDVIVDGTASREQPLVWIVSTAGTVRENVYDSIYEDAVLTINSYDLEEVYDEHTIYFVYELDNPIEWRHEKYWIKANPELGSVKNIEELRRKVELAKKDSKRVSNLLTKDFNIRGTSRSAWLDFYEINNEEIFSLEDLKPRYGIGGIDLSKTTDLTCATVLFRVTGDPKVYVEQMYWIPSEKLEDKVKEDKIPYDKWYEQGLLRLSEGGVINYRDITEWFLEVQNEMDIYIFKIGYDNWSASYLVEELKGHFGKNALKPVIQGKKTLSSPMGELGAELKAKNIIYNNHPILKWCMTNVAIDMDKNGNIQPVKNQNAKARIDGFSSLLDAYVVYKENYEDYMNII